MPQGRAPAPLRVDAWLADHVEIRGELLTIAGTGWNHLIVGSLPTVMPRVGLGMLVRVPPDQCDVDHEIVVRVEDADGALMPLEQDGQQGEGMTLGFRVGSPPQDAMIKEQLLPLAINIDRFKVSTSGVHRFVIAIDGIDSRIIPFAVMSGTGADERVKREIRMN